MTRLARVPLGPIGLEYFNTRLRPFEQTEFKDYPGGYPLRSALSRHARGAGVVWTWAPPGSRPSLEEVRDASLPAGISQRHHRALLFAFILAYLARPNSLLMIEDHDAGPRDRFLVEEPRLTQWVRYRNHVYWYATPADRRIVWKVLNWGTGLYTCVVLADGPGLWAPTKPLTRRRIERIAESADHIVIDAYDFEGTVVWSRTAAGLRLVTVKAD